MPEDKVAEQERPNRSLLGIVVGTCFLHRARKSKKCEGDEYQKEGQLAKKQLRKVYISWQRVVGKYICNHKREGNNGGSIISYLI